MKKYFRIYESIYLNKTFTRAQPCNEMERTQPPAPLVNTHISPPLPSSESMEESPGKKVSEKKPGNKNFGKKSEFYQVLGKNVTGNKVLVLDS